MIPKSSMKSSSGPNATHVNTVTENIGTVCTVMRDEGLTPLPGLGVVDFDAVVAAMPEHYCGDYMIEVDVPSVESGTSRTTGRTTGQSPP
jgi:hypothetical protein